MRTKGTPPRVMRTKQQMAPIALFFFCIAAIFALTPCTIADISNNQAIVSNEIRNLYSKFRSEKNRKHYEALDDLYDKLDDFSIQFEDQVVSQHWELENEISQESCRYQLNFISVFQNKAFILSDKIDELLDRY